ncbi:hypothetical protein GCM10023310_68980 [Paenibacillus vulneris]|uniref:Uncharacterized protein n=1 Tax=Paenibacillus vulneris TaxID=1133364 RepID=A0ABW3UIH9_9BACL
MQENKVYVKPKHPMLNRKVSDDYEHSELLWAIRSNFKSNGGLPEVVGLIAIKNDIRYKVLFPNSTIDYFRLDNFEKFYELTMVNEQIELF